MSHIVQCIETDRLPLEVKLEVRDGEKFCVYLLPSISRPGKAGASAGSLRSTVLLKSAVDPPPEASLVFEVSIYDPGTGDPVTMRTQRLGSSLNTDYVRPHVRSRVTPGMELRSGSRLEVILLDLRRVTFTLQLEEEIASRASSAIGGGGIRHKQPVAGGDTGAFLYYTVRSVLTINVQYLLARFAAVLQRLGIPTWIIPIMLTAILVVGGLGYYAYTQARAANAAEEAQAAAEDSQREAQAAAEVSLVNEMACLAQQQTLAMRLGLQELQDKALIQETMRLTFTNSVVIGEGGAIYGGADVLAYDQEQIDSLLDFIHVRYDDITSISSDADTCMAQEALLQPDLPAYVLMWHPDPDLVCPQDYSDVIENVPVRGPFGLSDRVKRQYGGDEREDDIAQAAGATSSDLDTDPRMAIRWSTEAFISGLREVQSALLAADAGNRVVVAPSQSHLWTLALWDAYNRLPSPGGGTLDETASACITKMVIQVNQQARPAEPGAPLLPNIVAVAVGDEDIRLSPTPGCMWSEDVIKLGAQQALLSVARATFYTAQGPTEDRTRN